MKIHFTLFFALFSFICLNTNAQSFLTDNEIELGVRVGTNLDPYSMNYSATARKHFDFGSAEFLIDPHNLMFTGLYTIHGNDLIKDNFAGDTSGFTYFFGFGGHVGVYTGGSIVGVDGIAGVEYKIPDLPLKASVDIKPTLDFVTAEGLRYFNVLQGGATIRYVF